LGRFVNRDPIGYEGSRWNLYEYGADNPITNKDPLGLDCESDFQDETLWCNYDDIACNRDCLANDPPWGFGKKGGWRHVKLCESKCLAKYMACYAAAEAKRAACHAAENAPLICGAVIVTVIILEPTPIGEIIGGGLVGGGAIAF